MKNNLSKMEKLLKSCFKEKIRVTTATVVAFLITGTAGYGENNIIPEIPSAPDVSITQGSHYGTQQIYGTNNVNKNIVVDGSSIGVEPGAGAQTSQGISADNNTMTNSGNIWVKNGYAEGMGTKGASLNSTIINEGNIYISDGVYYQTKGMSVNPGGKAINRGTIMVNGGSGITDNSGSAHKSLLNDTTGHIFVGDNSYGIYYRKEKVNANNSIENKGSIIVIGDNSVGVKLHNDIADSLIYHNKEFINSGIITVSGIGSKAIEGDDSNNIVYLKTGSHIEGLIDLGAGSDTINIDGVKGDNNSSEIIHTEGVEKIIVNNSNIEFLGNISTDDTAVVLGNKNGDNRFVNSGSIIAGTGIMTSNDGSQISNSASDRLNLLEIVNRGEITAETYGIFHNAYNTKYNPLNVSNEGNITVTGFVDSTSGGKSFVYSNGIYVASRPNGGKAFVNNSGSISVDIDEVGNQRLEDLFVQSNGDMYANISALRLHEYADGVNTGDITVNASTGIGVLLTAGDTGANLVADYKNFTNSGTISMAGNYTKGILASNSTDADNKVINNGTITINGNDSIGILAKGNSTAINNGVIALNVYKADSVILSGNIAMKAEGVNASITSNGTIKLTDVNKSDLSTDSDIDNLLSFVNTQLIQGQNGETHLGIVKDANNNIIAAAGDEISGTVGDIEENEVYQANSTVTIMGTQLNGTLNAGTNLGEDEFLLNITSNDLNIGGTINAANNGITVSSGSNVTLTGTISATNTAIELESNTSFNSNGATINGNITSVGDTTINLSNSSVAGNINLGNGIDNLTIDKATAESFSKNSIISGGEGQDILNIGSENEVTIIKGTLQNFETKNFSGTVFLDAESNILITPQQAGPLSAYSVVDYGAGNIEIKGDLVLGIKELGDGTYNHALTDISGNTISGDGTLYADTRKLNIGKDGITVDLDGTIVDLEAEQIKATQFIYNVALNSSNTRFGGNLLDISINQDVSDMGINGKYQDVWNSILESDQENSIKNTTTFGDASDLEYLMHQTKERNIYSLGTKLAYDSMKLYEFGIENFTASPETGKWLMQAKGIGSYDKNEKSAEFNTTGVITAAEYGLNDNSSVGLSLGAGKQEAKFGDLSSKLESDTFYFGAYGKHKMDNFKFLAGAGYQYNKVDATNISANGFDSFTNSSDLDSKGFNILGKVTYIHELESGLRLEPNAGISFNYLKQDSADEGGKDWAISVDSSTSKTTDFKVGLDLIKEFSSTTGKGEAFLSLGQKFTTGDTSKNLTARFNGTTTSDYEVEGFKIDKNLTSIGAGVDIENINGFFYGASYTYEFNDRAKNHKVGIGLGYKF